MNVSRLLEFGNCKSMKSFEDTNEHTASFGTKPNGIAIFTADGRTMAIVTAERPRGAASVRSMVAYSGTYRLENDRWITTVAVTWNESWMGTSRPEITESTQTRSL